jgi:hypothetical protein
MAPVRHKQDEATVEFGNPDRLMGDTTPVISYEALTLPGSRIPKFFVVGGLLLDFPA